MSQISRCLWDKPFISVQFITFEFVKVSLGCLPRTVHKLPLCQTCLFLYLNLTPDFSCCIISLLNPKCSSNWDLPRILLTVPTRDSSLESTQFPCKGLTFVAADLLCGLRKPFYLRTESLPIYFKVEFFLPSIEFLLGGIFGLI